MMPSSQEEETGQAREAEKSLARLRQDQAELRANLHALQRRKELDMMKLELNVKEEQLVLETELAIKEARAQCLLEENPGWEESQELRRANQLMSTPRLSAIGVQPTPINVTPIRSRCEALDAMASPFEPARQEVAGGLSTTRPGIQHYNSSLLDMAAPPEQVDPLTKLVNLLTERQGELPKKEPETFKGDVYHYPTWLKSWETLVESKRESVSDRLYYLGLYTSSEAKEAIKGFLSQDTIEAYWMAMSTLKERYGNAFSVAQAYKSRISKWPKIRQDDAKGLRDFSDFLRQCLTAMAHIKYLNSLDSADEIYKILEKLPKGIADRWVRIACRSLHGNDELALGVEQVGGNYPTFSKFCEFLQNEARVACCAASMQPEAAVIPVKRDDYRNTGKSLRSFASGADEVDKSKNDFKFKESASSHKPPLHCIACKGNHMLEDCQKYLALSTVERVSFASGNGLCFACIRRGHKKFQCRSRNYCEKCGLKHHTTLHDDSFKPRQDAAERGMKLATASASATSHSISSTSSTDCSHTMIVPVTLHHESCPERKAVTYALLDEQSDACFVTERLINEMHMQGFGQPVDLKLSTILGEEVVASKKYNGLVVRGCNIEEEAKILLPAVYTRDIPVKSSQIPSRENVEKWPHLKEVAAKLVSRPAPDVKVGLLIGMNCPRAIRPREIIAAGDDDPYAVKTTLGWSVVGAMTRKAGITTDDKACHFAFRTQVKEILPAVINKMFELEFNEVKSDAVLSVQDLSFMQQVKDGIHQKEDGHFEMPLPLKNSKELQLPNNKWMAVKRLQGLKRKLTSNSKFKQDYTTFMEDMIKKGYAERVPEEETNKAEEVWYIPHHGVYHPRKPGKIRVVFDCSAEYEGESLNKHLLHGPDLTNSLVGVLCRFRSERVAITCDIEGMFLQVGVNSINRDLLRFLWWEDDDYSKQPSVFRMTVHLFGAASSPGCANFALKSAAEKFGDEIGPKAAAFVKNGFYVDDGLTSVHDEATALKLIEDTQELCRRGGFRLHKFTSNNKEVLHGIPVSERSKELQEVDITQALKLPVEQALGVQWSIESDAFQFRVQLRESPLTRRGILSTVSSIFDPLGLVSPLLLTGKSILQDLCRDGLGWDDPVSDEIRSRWERWRCDVVKLSKLQIPRCYKPSGFGAVVRTELHTFSDASMTGYGECSYLRMVDDKDEVCTALVMGKSRVAPVRPITVPRLELTAAVLAVNVGNLLEKELDFTDVTHYYYTDSKVVLGYITNESKRFHIFVANRVQKIRDYTSPKDWNYVNTKENPADLSSRGVTAEELMESQLWWKGPPFLSKSQLPVVEEMDKLLKEDDPEIKKVVVHAIKVEKQPVEDLEGRLKVFSKWHSARRAIAVCLKLKDQMQAKVAKCSAPGFSKSQLKAEVKKRYTPVDVHDIQRAEKVIVGDAQQRWYAKEMKALQQEETGTRRIKVKTTSCLFRLDPFVEDGLLRVGGRIQRCNLPRDITRPLVLPPKSVVATLIVAHYHEKCGHGGRNTTLGEIRASGYWITRAAVSKYVWNCITCRKLRAPPTKQKMADLPEDRLEPAPPFTYSGVDYFGPFYVKEGRSEKKRWGVLFTCMASRAVHLEVAHTMTTDSFLNAYRRFVCRRGPVRQLRSDQGTNFVGVKSELDRALVEMDDDKVTAELLKENCDWITFKMNPPHASHMGGVWERLIRMARNALAALLTTHGHQLNDEMLATLMTEAEAIVNSRPLTCPDAASPDTPLSPSQILTLKSKAVQPLPGSFGKADIYCRKRWRRVQFLANEFWCRWKKEFLPTLQERKKWEVSHPNLTEGDIVLLIDDTTPRNKWPLGRITRAHPDQDGHVRKISLSVGQSELDRPVHKVILLLSQEPGIPIEEP